MRAQLSRFLAGVALLAYALPADALTYRVGPGRTYTQPSQVAGLLNPGDVVEIDGNATYSGVLWTRSGTSSLPITIRGTLGGTQRPVINANGAADAFRMDVNHYLVEDVVISNAINRCVYLRGTNLTLRRVVVHTCRDHGILGSDTLTGDMTLTEVEVYGSGNQASPQSTHHPIYIATDQQAHPNAVLTIEKSWIHDNFSGNGIKSRAKTVRVRYNWIEATNAQNHTVELIGPDGPSGAPVLCPVPNGSNDAQLCTGEIVGNVLIARGNNANMVRLGSDGTGWTHGRYHVVNNTFVANGTFNSSSAAMIRAFGPIQSIELHNNIFWIQQGDSVGIRIVRDVEAEWVNGRRVTGRRNVVTGNASTYASGIPASQIQGLTETIFTTTTAPLFANLSGAVLAAGSAIDLRLVANSVARNARNAGSTSTAGYEIPNPTNLPPLHPPVMRPDPGSFVAAARPQATDGAGNPVNAISVGAFEFGSAPSLDPAADQDGDGIPNGIEPGEGRDPLVKDNDVFGNARLFVMQQYRDFFGREGDAQGVMFWTGRVASGTSRAQLIESFLASAEFEGVVAPIARLYFAYFLRLPDYGGLNYWIAQYRGGMSLTTVSGYFASSPEFAQRYGALNNGQFVDLVYQNVLARAPDTGGRNFWTAELDSGRRTRGQVMMGFSESPEYRALMTSEVQVTMAYLGMLRRAPDSGGYSFWVDYMDQGNSVQALLSGFLAAPEYRARFLP